MGACRKMPIFVDMCSADSAGGCRHLSAAPREDSHNARAAFRACHQRSLVKPDDNNRNHRNHRNHRNPETDSKYLKMIQDDTNNSFMWTETYILYHLLNMWQLCEFLQQKSSTNTAGSSFEALLVLILSCACQGHGGHGSLHWMVDRFLLQQSLSHPWSI